MGTAEEKSDCGSSDCFDHTAFYCSFYRRHVHPALYFPNYWDPTELAHDEEELRELFSEAEQCGNDTRYVALNTFIRKYLDILRVYNQKQISEEAYQIVLKDYLSQLKED